MATDWEDIVDLILSCSQKVRSRCLKKGNVGW